MSNFKPSPYQSAVYDFVKDGSGNAIVGAVAGSGKSTTILEAIKRIPETDSVLLLAFNKSIVEELTIKVGGLLNVEVKTLHSLGMRSILSTMRTKVDGSKYRSFLNRAIKSGAVVPNAELSLQGFAEWKANIRKLTDLIRVNLCRSFDGAEALAAKHGLHLIDNELAVVNRLIKWGKNAQDTIDFTDMIFYPNAFDFRVPTYDWVFIDECQDLNAAQRELFLKCVKPETGRWVAVGDENQAIYGFAGADSESFKVLRNLPNTAYLPLSVCYRCGSDIIAAAKEIVPQIEPFEGAAQGTVDASATYKAVEDGDMVLCRVTAPLVRLCMQYIAEGRKAYVKGRDIGANLITLLDNTRKTNVLDALRVLSKELNKVARQEAARLTCDLGEAKTTPRYTSLEDKVEALVVLSEGLTQTRQLVSRIKSIFSDGETVGVCLSTIHKSKGLEADRVYILRPDKLYLKQAMAIPWMAQQEENLVYVAYTRAKKYLGFITDFDNQ